MHIVAIAWLYIIGAMALALSSAVAGVALFAVVGVAPVGLVAALLVRRRRAQRASALERDVHRGDDADAERDQ